MQKLSQGALFQAGTVVIVITAVAAHDNDTNNVHRMFHISADAVPW